MEIFWHSLKNINQNWFEFKLWKIIIQKHQNLYLTWFAEVRYQTPSQNGVCGYTTGGGKHQRCLYRGDKTICKEKCNDDITCKGYSESLLNTQCSLVTTSLSCPQNWELMNEGNIGPIKNNPTQIASGCFIKERTSINLKS